MNREKEEKMARPGNKEFNCSCLASVLTTAINAMANKVGANIILMTDLQKLKLRWC